MATSDEMFDEGVRRLEEVKRLRRSVTAYKGHLTRAYDGIKSLCSNPGSLSEIMTRKSALDDLFARYSAAVQCLLQTVVDLEDQERISLDHRHEVHEKALFDEEFTEWFYSARQFVSVETELTRVSTPVVIPPEIPRELPRETPLETPRVSAFGPISPELPRETPLVTPRDVPRDTPREQLFQRGPGSSAKDYSHNGSRRSSSSKSSKTRLAFAQLRLRKLEQEQKLEAKKQELEVQRLEVEMQRRLLCARMEVEQAQIELSDGSGESGDGNTRPTNLPLLPKQTLQETVDRYLSSCDDDRSGSAPIPPLQPKKDFPGRDISDKPERVDAPEEQSILKVQQEAMKRHDEAVRLMASGLEKIEMPKREFLTFDGDPKRYPRFIKSFEINVERRVEKDDEKLSYLIQYCKGAAKDAIENCLMLPPDEGYKEAKVILRKNFGQKHTVVRAFIDKVVKGPPIRAWESEKLSQLARDMKNCALNSEHMHYKADINSMDTLKRIVMRLPPHLQAKWAEESNKLIEAETEPKFSHLATFVEKRATVANTAFGKLVGAKPEGDIKSKPRRRPGGDPPATVTSLGIQSTTSGRTSNGPSPSQPSVGPVAQGTGKQVTPLARLFCNGAHSLERCFKFRDKTYDEQKEFVLTKRLCVNCLKTNHLARRCTFRKPCLFSGCGQRHHSLLHPPPAALEGVERPASCTTRETSPEDIPQNGASGAGPLQDVQCAAVNTGSSRVSLQIVPVRVRGRESSPEIETYAFLDNGSDTTLCLNSLAESLGVSGKPVHFSLSSINAENTPRSGYEVALNVVALDGDDTILLDKVWTVDRLPISKRSVPSDEDVSQ
ncbi:uncharacterized protein LOC144642460 [Oculina patagonica]